MTLYWFKADVTWENPKAARCAARTTREGKERTVRRVEIREAKIACEFVSVARSAARSVVSATDA
ncbi:hypothetical protein [Patulibacter defluvii]|uniref:hypothetical protein n=1 Tax=Patulibacter defluvii TaxID=3095358 RepID=UPI002A761C45|nr:hypothetical protein [Patulibacter sp. DM4]